jgi:methyl-accepting chemotaxis protein
MFRNMKLATKIGVGFAIVIIISGVMGYVGWSALSTLVNMAGVQEQGSQSNDALNKCATLRRDFVIYGFEKQGNDTKDTAEKWLEACGEVEEHVNQLALEKGLSDTARQLVTSTQTQVKEYRQIFDTQVKVARKETDSAFGAWTKIGGEVTAAVTKLRTDTVAPALAKAREAQNLEQVNLWTTVDEKLQSDVIAPFFLLRVTAVYFAKTQKDEQFTNYQNQLKKVQAGTDSWSALAATADPKMVEVAKELQGHFTKYEEAGAKFHAGVEQSNKANADMVSMATTMVKNMNDIKAELANQMASTSASSNFVMVTMVLAGILVGSLLGFTITRSIVKPINRVITGLTDGSQQVSAASSQVSSSSQSLAEGASEQASSLEETSSSLEEMASMTKQNAANAKQANALADEAFVASNRGDEAVKRMADAIGRIKQSSDETARIIKVIDEIAFQTNLLALNAAVEAARAGEAGKGFAVVAEEVRNLAQRSAEAAKNTAQLIDGAQKNADDGVRVTEEVTEALKEIGTGIKKVTDLLSEVSAASDEQSRGVEQINVAVGQMDQVTQQVAANAEESAAASEELSAQAQQLNEMVADLAAVVGGRHETGATGQRAATHATAAGKTGKHFDIKTRSGKAVGAKSPAAKAPAAEAKVKPEHVIPMDEHEDSTVLSKF